MARSARAHDFELAESVGSAIDLKKRGFKFVGRDDPVLIPTSQRAVVNALSPRHVLPGYKELGGR